MKKSLLSLIITCIFLVAIQKPLRAQYILKKADAQYKLYNFYKAIDLYEQAYRKKPGLHAAERLSKCYERIRNYKQTESWSLIAAELPGSDIENTLRYAKALQSNSKYHEAKVQFQKYIEKNSSVGNVQRNLWLSSCDSALHWMKNPVSMVVSNLKMLNTPKSEWGAGVYLNRVVFVSDRENELSKEKKQPFLKFDGAGVPDKNIYGWTGNHYMQLYEQNEKADSVKIFPLKIETNYHVGPASFTKDGAEVYFSLSRISENPKYINGKIATAKVEIFSSRKDQDGKWLAPASFKYNNINEYSVGDPFVSKDGEQLYFVSDMPGGLGGTDIYVCHRKDTSEWSTPVNLKELNTEGEERSPGIDESNHIYFSSDGRIGMGGLDIFAAKIISGKITEPINQGYPVNSPQYDFSYYPVNSSKGFLSSNRIEGLGEDDIYSFQEQMLTLKLTGKVFRKNTNEPLANAIVKLSKATGQSVMVHTDEDGSFKFDLDKAMEYRLTGDKTGFIGDAENFNTKNYSASTTLHKNLYLDMVVINKPIKLENIYYNFNQSTIRPDAALELNKLIHIMKENPTIWIDLNSHTDSRGTDGYNLQLSERRAKAAVQYIISAGIEKNRIMANGYGETQLLNRCKNGIKCASFEHELNRRTEFEIVKF